MAAVKQENCIYQVRILLLMTKPSTIKFTKMHGLGNDFVVIDGIHQAVDLSRLPIQKLANRHTGIGFDQLLLIEPSKKADVFCRFYNSDGSEAEQCGNGVRAVARFLHENNLISNDELKIETLAGVVDIHIQDYEHIQATLGIPSIGPQKIITIDNHDPVSLSLISMGNPHAILQVPTLKNISIQEIGQKIATHTSFPQGVNVGFMEVVNSKHIRLMTYERGVGKTFACGSNACAAVVSGVMNGLLNETVSIELPLGTLIIEWKKGNNPVKMTGPAEKIFSGEI